LNQGGTMSTVEEMQIDNKLSQVKEAHDMKLKCTDCKKDFTFTAGEQVYYVDKGLAFPKRCEPCRMIRRTKIQHNSIQIQDKRPE
jgi:hypothetical protein